MVDGGHQGIKKHLLYRANWENKGMPTKKIDSPQNLQSNDGLRYVARQNGSPFGSRLGSTRSCFKCGAHKPREAGSFAMLLGVQRLVCGGCGSPKT